MDNKQAIQFFGMIIGLFFQFILGGTLRTEIAINNPINASAETTYFKQSYTAHHWIAGLVRTDTQDLNALTAKYSRNGDSIARASITTRITAVDSLCAIFTLFIYTPNTVDVEGQLLHTLKVGPVAVEGQSMAVPK